MKKLLLITVIFFAFLSIAHAENLNSPVGEWITYSDKTHDRSGIVEIYTSNSKLFGKIIKIFPGKDRDPADRCVKCTGDLKDKPILGLEFLWNFVLKNDGSWGNGQLLDPKDGKIYKGKIKLIDGGKKLELRGSWGIFSRTQTWIRVDASQK